MSEAEKIAAGLTMMQRWAVTRIGTDRLHFRALHGGVRVPLFKKKILHCVQIEPPIFELTPLGHQVRAVLQERSR